MAKNIVLLSDGTGNSAAKLLKTNVWRLYESLLLDDPTVQVACYDDGVGTSGFKPLRLLGGAFGVGLMRNVLRLYRFLCEHYEPGDRIYLFGFSRGAFTVRVLMGLICSQGIIRTPRSGLPREVAVAYPDIYGVFSGELARRARWAYRNFRRQFNQAGVAVTVARMARDVVFRLKELPRPPYSSANNHPPPPIEFIGVWDTVDAYGLPVDELTAGIDRWVWPLSMPDLSVPSNVRRACHVLAIDDERNSLHPVLWDESGDVDQAAATTLREERVSQVWFAGMHANVGGGYADDSLAYVSFEWMVTQVRALAAPLRFSHSVIDGHLGRTDALGRVYDSRSGLKAYYRYNPRRIEWLTNGQEHETRLFTKHAPLRLLAAAWMLARRWINTLLRRAPRLDTTVTTPLPKIHESVFERIAAAPEAYSPLVLPQDYRVVLRNGDFVAADEYESVEAREKRMVRQESAWDLVWLRRVLYFTAVGATVVLLLTPFLEESLALRSLPPQGLAGRAIKAAGDMLPPLASPIVDYYAARPEGLWPLVVIVLSYLAGRRVQLRIQRLMREAWLRTVPPPGERLTDLDERPSWLSRLRTSDVYQALLAIVRHRLLPTVFGVAALMWLTGAANRAPFEVANIAGGVCRPPASATRLNTGATSAPVWFSNIDACMPVGLTVRRGEAYRLVFTDRTHVWKDGSIPAPFPEGFTSSSVGLTWRQRVTLLLFAPFRRDWTDRWFALTARVGRTGADYYTLRPSDPQQPNSVQLTAQTDGPLYLFVNDAIAPIAVGRFGWTSAYYGNNRGHVRFTVTRLR